MPELPEVETTRAGLAPHVVGQHIERVIVRERRFRWPIPTQFSRTLKDKVVVGLSRRGKYLLWECAAPSSTASAGFILSHLGMSGSLQVVSKDAPVVAHDHVDIVLKNDSLVRFNDPRRFGAMLWIGGVTPRHALLDKLGPEPLTDEFSGRTLFTASRGRSVSVKEFIMNGHVVVGVGNIYASESLFHAGIDPRVAAGRISLARYQRLAQAIKQTLAAAIAAGGSSLRDYVQTDGTLGYFQNQTRVYDRADCACMECGHTIKSLTQGQRSTYFCPRCQR